MPFLLDTCLLTETWKPTPNAGVLTWLANADEDDLFFSVLSLGEIRKGIDRLGPGRRREALERDFVRLRGRFTGRVIAIDEPCAERWGQLSATVEAKGRPMHVADGLIAATAIVHGHTVVTRNVRHFEAAPVPLLDPWT